MGQHQLEGMENLQGLNYTAAGSRKESKNVAFLSKTARANLFNYKNINVSHSQINKTKITLGQVLMTLAHPAVWR